MDTKKKIILGVAVVIIVLVFLYFAPKSTEPKKTNSSAPKQVAGGTSTCKEIPWAEWNDKKNEIFHWAAWQPQWKRDEIYNQYNNGSGDLAQAFWAFAHDEMLRKGYCGHT